MLAKDIMKRRVLTVRPEMTLKELAQLFGDKRITGAPVVDVGGRLLGVVSQTDLVRRDRESPADDPPSYHRHPEESLAAGFHVEAPDYTRVADVMTPGAIARDEETPVEELAQLMLRKHIHRVVISRGGVLSGLVTSMDLLKALLGSSRKRKP